MLHSLSKHHAFKVGRAKTLAFPTSPLCFPWQFRENRDTFVAAHTIPADNPRPSQGQNLYTTVLPCTWEDDAWSYMIWAKVTEIRQNLYSDLRGFLIRLLMACKQCCLLAGVREWSFNLHCRLFLPNSAVTLQMQDCKHRLISLSAARICVPRICLLG